MTVFGVDLGVRSFHACGIRTDSDELVLSNHKIKTPKSVSAQDVLERSGELYKLAMSMMNVIKPGDMVFIEEPPYVRNVRTLLKLAQVSAAMSVGSALNFGQAVFVPVDTWKQAVIGKGGVSKADVAQYLRDAWPGYSEQCQGNQDYIDATCLAIYGAHHYDDLAASA